MGEFGITIITGGKKIHTRDLNLKMTAFHIPMPDTKTNYIAIPGASVSIDLSEVMGGVTYDRRNDVTFTFVLRNDFNGWAVAVQRLAEQIHGKECKVIVDNDLSHYYVCRLEIDPAKSSNAVGTVTISGSAQAYKYDLFASDDEWEWDPFDFETGVIRDMIDIPITETSKQITIIGSTKKQTPVFVVKETNHLAFSYNRKTYDLSKVGEYRFPSFKVANDNITITFTGTGKLSIRFRGAYL